MKLQGKLVYWQTLPMADGSNIDDREPDVVIELNGSSVGISIPPDGSELNYFSQAEAAMLAEALNGFAQHGEEE